MKKQDIDKFFENGERQLINNFKQKEEAEKISREPANRRLKYAAIGILSIGVVLEIVMLIWYDQISDTAILWMEGIIGLCAIIFVVLVAWLYYRINKKSINKRYGKNS